MNLAIFLITLAVHIPVVFLAEDEGILKAPDLLVSYSLDKYSPVVVFSTNHKKATFEVESITPYGLEVFRTSTTDKDFDLVYGAPCHVRVRAKVGQLVSDWSKPVWVDEKKNKDFFHWTSWLLTF